MGLCDTFPTDFKHETFDSEGDVLACCCHYPLPQLRSTIYRARECLTLARVEVDLTGAWEHGQVYVALARAKRASALRIVN